jgi:hypothetical protein
MASAHWIAIARGAKAGSVRVLSLMASILSLHVSTAVAIYCVNVWRFCPFSAAILAVIMFNYNMNVCIFK